MFGLFKKRSKLETLNRKYQKLMEESHKLSSVNRKASDEKYAEANRVMDEIQQLETAGAR